MQACTHARMHVHTHCKKLFGQFETLSMSEMSCGPSWYRRRAARTCMQLATFHMHHTTKPHQSVRIELVVAVVHVAGAVLHAALPLERRRQGDRENLRGLGLLLIRASAPCRLGQHQREEFEKFSA